MAQLTWRSCGEGDLGALSAFCERYRRAYPDAKLMSPEFYTCHPLLEGGRNLFCALDGAGRIAGMAPLFPAPVAEDSPPSDPHHIWTIVVADPSLQGATEARALLLGRVLERSGELKATFTPRPVRLACDMMASQRPDIDYLLGQGFEHYESMYVMRHRGPDAVPQLPAPKGVAVRRWRMPSAAEQAAYLRAYNACFADMPKAPETLQFFLQSDRWPGGTAVAAFDGQGELAGSVLAYAGGEQGCGIVDDVFVLPGYRRRGIARYLMGEALRYLYERGVAEVMLEVRANNAPAVALYKSAGYAQANEEVLLGRML